MCSRSSGPSAGRSAVAGRVVVVLQGAEPRQLVVPLLLERIGDQSMLRTHEHELPLRQFGVLPRALDLRAAQPVDLGLALAQFVEDLQSDVERGGRHRLEHDLDSLPSSNPAPGMRWHSGWAVWIARR